MFDVAIVGGGPAGCAAALKLHGLGARILILERATHPIRSPGETLKSDAIFALDELGVRSSFEALRPRRSAGHAVRWGNSYGLKRPAPDRGHDIHIDRAEFDAMLLDRCQQVGVSVERGVSLEGLEVKSSRSRLFFKLRGRTESIEASAIIDATGRAHKAIRRVGARRERVDRLIALAANYEFSSRVAPSLEYAPSLVETTDAGWWYTAPGPAGRLVALFVTDAVPRMSPRLNQAWSEALRSAPHTRARLAQLVQVDAVTSHAANPALTQFDPALPVLPVGDAALSFDPLSGDGLCFALRSGIEAARAVHQVDLRCAYQRGVRGIYEAHLRDREVSYGRAREEHTGRFWQAARSGTR